MPDVGGCRINSADFSTEQRREVRRRNNFETGAVSSHVCRLEPKKVGKDKKKKKKKKVNFIYIALPRQIINPTETANKLRGFIF